MTELLKQAIAEMEQLPSEEQDAIASIIFEELRDEVDWANRFRNSQAPLSKWAGQVRSDIRNGRVSDLEITEL